MDCRDKRSSRNETLDNDAMVRWDYNALRHARFLDLGESMSAKGGCDGQRCEKQQ